jgi:hypothetical protein
MADSSPRTDQFPTISGLLGAAAGPILVARGAPTGWSLLLSAVGLTLLSIQWLIAKDVAVDFAGPRHVAVVLGGVACIAIAAVYLTRAASDLPSLFPGHDADSEHYRIVPGVVTLMVGLVVFGRSAIAAVSLRGSH